jgi:flagellar basal-body rod protein FlgC
MITGIHSTLSALRAFGDKIGVAAHNVANVETEGFKKQRALLSEEAEQGVRVDIEQVNTPGPLIPSVENGQTVVREGSNVDLAEEIPEAKLVRRYYQANLRLLETQDEMVGSLIDILG